jgi:hypothetical protein
LRRDSAHPPDPTGNTSGGHPRASCWVMAAGGWSARAARDRRTWACACPILSPGSIAVTGIRADSAASVDRLDSIYARQTPRGDR